MRRLLTLLPALLLLPSPPSDPARPPRGRRPPLVLLENRTALVREETIRVSVPFPEGQVKGIPALAAEGKPTAWRILELWPDGSTRVARAQFPLRLPPGGRINIPLVEGKPLEGPFKPHPWYLKRRPGPFFLLEASLPGDPPLRIPVGEGGEVLASTPLVRTTRRILEPGKGWSLAVYLSAFSADPLLQADLVLRWRGEGSPPPTFRHLDLVEEGLPALLLHPRLSTAGAPLRDREGRLHLPLLVRSAPGPGQVFRWRVFLLLDDPSAPTLQRGIARRTWQARAIRPLDPLCDAGTWLASGALTPFGGPAPPPPDWRRRILRETVFRAGKKPFGRYDLPPLPPGGAGAAKVPPCDPFWLHAVQTSRGGLLEYLSPGFDAWTGLGAWWARDLFLERIEAWKGEVRAAGRLSGPAAEGLLARTLAEAALVRPGSSKENRTLLAERLRGLVLPRLRKGPSWVPPAQAAPFLLGMYAAWRHLKVAEARKACILFLQDLSAKPALPAAAALPLHLLSLEPTFPETLRKKARTLSASLLSGLEEAERLWDPRTALVPIPR